MTQGNAIRPLEGVRVLDFCWVWAGPVCTLTLALLGAEVIKVETTDPRRIDLTRRAGPWFEDITGPNSAGYFNQYNQEKRSITLDLKNPEAIVVVKDLVAASDIVTENFALGVMDRLGLGYAELRKVKPDIIMITMSGYGVTGPTSHYSAYGMVQVPMIGLTSLSGYPGMGPDGVGISYGDPNAGLHGAFAVMAALRHRRRTGEGQFIDMSQWEAGIGLVAEGLMEYVMNGAQPPRQGNRDLWESPQGVFPCSSEDEWVAISCWSDEQWQGLCRAIGRLDLMGDSRFAAARDRKRQEGELEALISSWTKERTPDEAVQILQANGVPSYHVLSCKDLAEDEQMNARGHFVDLEHPEIGARRHVGSPWQFSRSDVRVHRTAPLLGEYTDEALRDILGYDETKIAALRASGALG